MKTTFFQFIFFVIFVFGFPFNKTTAQINVGEQASVSVDLPVVTFRMSLVPTGMLKCKCILKNPKTGAKIKIKEILSVEELEGFYEKIETYKAKGYTRTKKHKIKKQQKIIFRFGKDMHLEEEW